ncbi:MAG: EamA family transporter [Gemmatimonadales bacterium]
MSELRGRALVAYLIVCIVWGTTYLAIRVGVMELPPFLFGGARFVIAGLLLGAIALTLGLKFPRAPEEWAVLAIGGVMLLFGGNGMLVWAEQYVDAGAASIYVVTVAIWSALFDALVPGGTVPFTWRLAAGLLIGLLGAVVLTGTTPRALMASDLRGPLVLLGASASWGLGTVLLKRRPTGASALSQAAVEMVAGGLALLALSFARGEHLHLPLSREAWFSFAYLVVLGSIVGYTAYAYALNHAPATIVGTYAYVNPVVAVLLGWLLLHEELSARKLLGMAVIVGAVLWVRAATKTRRPVLVPEARERAA